MNPAVLMLMFPRRGSRADVSLMDFSPLTWREMSWIERLGVAAMAALIACGVVLLVVL